MGTLEGRDETEDIGAKNEWLIAPNSVQFASFKIIFRTCWLKFDIAASPGLEFIQCDAFFMKLSAILYFYPIFLSRFSILGFFSVCLSVYLSVTFHFITSFFNPLPFILRSQNLTCGLVLRYILWKQYTYSVKIINSSKIIKFLSYKGKNHNMQSETFEAFSSI